MICQWTVSLPLWLSCWSILWPVWNPFHSPNLMPSVENQTEEGGQPAHLFSGLIMSSITAPLLVAVFLILGISWCSFMLSPPKQLAWTWQSSHVIKEQLQNQKQPLFYWKLCTFVPLACNFFPKWRSLFLESHPVVSRIHCIFIEAGRLSLLQITYPSIFCSQRWVLLYLLSSMAIGK